MLVIVGANGRTGVEIVREALRRGKDVRAVVRDDRDARNLDDIIDVQQISYADPEQYASLPPALEGAESVVCIDPRTGGPGTNHKAPQRHPRREQCARAIVYVGDGCFRWSQTV